MSALPCFVYHQQNCALERRVSSSIFQLFGQANSDKIPRHLGGQPKTSKPSASKKVDRLKQTMSTFDLCCPGQGSKAPDSPAKRAFNPDDPNAVSDEDSFGPSPPPPPSEPHPDDQVNLNARTAPDGDKFTDEYSYFDGDGTQDMEKGSDPPQETTTDLSDADDEEELDHEEDQSVEIPPTNVVQRMMDRGDGTEKEGGRAGTLCAAGIVACCLVVAALVLGIGFGTGAFTKEKSASRAIEPDEDDGLDLDGGVDTEDGGDEAESPDVPTETPVVFTDPVTLAGTGLTEFIPGISLADPAVFDDTESAEYLAMMYIIENEESYGFTTEDEADRSRIIQLYSLLTLWYSSEDAWDDESGWVVTEDECGWTGVTCEEGVVVEVNLDSNGLTGGLPMDLAWLDSMRSLTLSNNNIMGALPRSLFVMPTLEELYIDNNIFEYEMKDISGMTGLTVFFASGNELRGDVSVFWPLTALTVIVIDDNAFSGTLDGISALENLSKSDKLGSIAV